MMKSGARGAAWVAMAIGCAGLAACAGSAIERDPLTSRVSANRPDGEGYAGKGEVVLSLGMSAPDANPVQEVNSKLGRKKPETARMELRYEGMDGNGNALFSRWDRDLLANPYGAGDEAAVLAHGHGAPADGGGGQEIVINLRAQRQIHIQGRTIEILDAHPEGLVFRLYTDS